MKDVFASYDMLVDIFERIQLFLQRLNCYTNVQLTTEMTELLGKIMAQVLIILALSTVTMKEGRKSGPIDLIYSSFADFGEETILKKLMGRTDIQDALRRLDTLTKEEGLMAAARNLEVTHHVDGNVVTIKEVIQDVDSNVKVTKELTSEVDGNVKAIKKLSHDVNSNVTTIKEIVHDVNSNLRVTKELTYKVGGDTKVIEAIARNIDDNVTTTKHGTHCLVPYISSTY